VKEVHVRSVREADIERGVVQWAKANGWLTWKNNGPGDRGKPDRTFVSPTGLVVFIEFKAPGKRPTALQKRWIIALHRHCANAEWFSNVGDAVYYLAQLEHEHALDA
jgi:hypothetical protein